MTQRGRVVNLRDVRRNPQRYGEVIRIDLSTDWGNQYRIGVHGNRAEVIELYRRELQRAIDLDPELMAEQLLPLAGRDLACWCAPEPCHGDVILAAVDWARNREVQNE